CWAERFALSWADSGCGRDGSAGPGFDAAPRDVGDHREAGQEDVVPASRGAPVMLCAVVPRWRARAQVRAGATEGGVGRASGDRSLTPGSIPIRDSHAVLPLLLPSFPS